MKLIYIVIFFVFLIMMNSVESGSMTTYLQGCNYNTYCEDSEDSETCPDDCPVDETPSEGSNSLDNSISSEENNLVGVRSDSQFIIKQEKPFPTKQVLSIVFVVALLILLVLLYSWIHNNKIRFKKKKKIVEQKKQILYPKPRRGLRV